MTKCYVGDDVMHVLKIEKLVSVDNKLIPNDFSLEIKVEKLCDYGTNGTGKSTLSKVIG